MRPADAIAIIVGIVVGAGIFKTPSMVAGVTGDVGWLIVAWGLGAIVSLAGALCYAELATAYPHAGGDYHFLTRAFGRHTSFLYAWARSTVINSGSIALLAFVFGDYMSTVVSLGPASGALWAAGIVIALTILNIAGLRASAGTQNLLTVIEVGGLLAVAVAGFLAPPVAAAAPAAFTTTPALGMFGLAMVFVLLTYGGWNEAAYISAELAGGRRAIVSALVIEPRDHCRGLPAREPRALVRPRVEGARRKQGAREPRSWSGRSDPSGRTALGLFVAIAALTSINATMIVGARTNYAMARDWPALRFMGGWHASRGTPVAAFLVQGAIALALVGFGALQHDGFEAMVEFTAPVFWSFLLLVGVALFVLRARDGGAERPFRVPLFPLTPIVFCAACAWLAYSSITYAASRNAVHISLLVMVAGVVAMLLARWGAIRRVAAGDD